MAEWHNTRTIDHRAPTDRWCCASSDFGDEPNDGNLCCDGLAWPDRTPKPAMFEHRALAAPLAVTLEKCDLAADVDEAFTPYIRPQESGGRHGVRRLRLSGAAGELAIRLDEPRRVSVTRHGAEDLPPLPITVSSCLGLGPWCTWMPRIEASAPPRAGPTRCRHTSSAPAFVAGHGPWGDLR